MAIQKILLINEDLVFRNFLVERLEAGLFHVASVENAQKALAVLKEQPFDLAILEIKKLGTFECQLVEKIKELHPQILILVIAGSGTIEHAVEAMYAGALYYLNKPVSLDAIEAVIEKGNQCLLKQLKDQHPRKGVAKGRSKAGFRLIAESPSMQKILADVEKIANSNASVCIHGETGTGKEVIAQLIHDRSARCARPFVKVNCAAIPETLIESEFFGHEKGSFTGASSRRLGRFELAHQGSLLLDEITETPLSFQAKLLRAVQEQEFERVGGAHLVSVDVRLISTSNRDIKAAVTSKMIREDLYYRLNVIPLFLKPLRERVEEIIPLAEYFIQKFATENCRKLKPLSLASKEKLRAYDWPGNVRELANLIERAVIMDDFDQITAEHLPIEQEIL